jgi:starch synthase
MEIIHVAAELAPIAKVGGLGDVLHGLSKALLNKNHSVRILLPKYDTLDLNYVKHLEIIETHLLVHFGDAQFLNTLWQGMVDGIPVIFFESHDPYRFFERGKVYGFPDDVSRFLYFCMSALTYLRKNDCDVLHLHDWHTAIIAGFVKDCYQEIKAKTVLTIHNLAYQGICTKEEMGQTEWHPSHLEEDGFYNLLKTGIIFADHVTTVSPSYAHELLHTNVSGPLQSTLKKYQKKFTGVLNGIDYSYWNPERDPLIPYHYSVHHLSNKEKVKVELKKRVSLADENCPLVSAITRLVPQKGPELLKAAILRILELGGQFVLLGSALDEPTHERFYTLKRKLAGCSHVHLELTFNEELSHLVFAASDLFLVPSIFEPCGLTQQIAMRYGAVPVARATGGLIDTVFDKKNGFTFGPPTAEAFHGALDCAITCWQKHPDLWKEIMIAGMQTDFSWNHPAEEYLKIYSEIS